MKPITMQQLVKIMTHIVDWEGADFSHTWVYILDPEQRAYYLKEIEKLWE